MKFCGVTTIEGVIKPLNYLDLYAKGNINTFNIMSLLLISIIIFLNVVFVTDCRTFLMN